MINPELFIRDPSLAYDMALAEHPHREQFWAMAAETIPDQKQLPKGALPCFTIHEGYRAIFELGLRAGIASASALPASAEQAPSASGMPDNRPEIAPDGEIDRVWDRHLRGRAAVAYLMSRSKVPIYVGNERGDEAAFRFNEIGMQSWQDAAAEWGTTAKEGKSPGVAGELITLSPCRGESGPVLTYGQVINDKSAPGAADAATLVRYIAPGNEDSKSRPYGVDLVLPFSDAAALYALLKTRPDALRTYADYVVGDGVTEGDPTDEAWQEITRSEEQFAELGVEPVIKTSIAF